MRGVKKSNLPKKICSACGLEFVWRKKWVKIGLKLNIVARDVEQKKHKYSLV